VEGLIEPGLGARLAAGPISWGVCEVPGWGLQLTPDRVFAEMTQLGITATELGPQGWLPLDGRAARRILDCHGLTLVGGFVPVIVHEPEVDLDGARAAATQLAEAGGELFVAAAVQDPGWGEPTPLDADGWKRAGERLRTIADAVAAQGVELVLHPHAGTVLETARDVEHALAHTDVPWCYDTGHLLIGGVDPVRFASEHGDRIGHVHFKDVDARVAARFNAKELSLMQAVQHGLFRPLGEGDARIEEVVRALAASGYERWLVLEQDLAITGSEPPVGSGPVLDVRKSIEFLSTRAPEEEVITR
jgi:inosose dehydratase